MTVKKNPVMTIGWLLLALLFAGSIINYLDRAVLGIVMPQIRRDLSLSNAEYGLAVNSFLVIYMIFYPIGGRIADWLGCRRSFILNVVTWSAASILQTFSRGLASLCFFRGLLGAAEGGFGPTSVRGVSDWFPASHRAKAVGILLCGLSVGSLLAPPIVATITLHYGWRAAFFITGCLGLFLLPPWFMLHRHAALTLGHADPAPARLIASESADPSKPVPTISEVVKRRQYLLVLMARSLTDATWFFYLFWTAGYFQEVRGFSLATVAKLLWIPFFCADIGALAGTWASSLLIQKGLGLNRSRKIVLVISGLLGVSAGLTVYVKSDWVALAILSAGLFGVFSWAGNVQTVILEISPRQHVAVLYGITGACGTLAAAISQPIIGRTIDHLGYVPVFFATGTAMFVALILILLAGEIRSEEAASSPQPVTAVPSPA